MHRVTAGALTALVFMFFLSGGRAVADCSKPALPGVYVNIMSHGATPDDGTDDTAAIQTAINATPTDGTLYIPAGTFQVNPNYAGAFGLKLKSNMTVWLADSAVLEAVPVASSQYAILSLLHISNVTITGGTIKGERSGHQGTTGEYGYGIALYSAQNIRIQNLTVRDCWGDGIYITGNTSYAPDLLSKNITVCDVVADNNRRQGLSVTAADYVWVEGSRFINSNGASVCSGIDLEPNPDPGSSPPAYTLFTVTNVSVLDCEMTGNCSHGINVYRANDANTIEHNMIKQNLRNGVRVFEAGGTSVLRNWIGDNGKAAISDFNFADVELVSATNTLVKQNTLRDGTPYHQVGVWLQGTGLGNTITDNDICMNVNTYPIRNDTGSPFVASGNTSCERDPYAQSGGGMVLSFLHLLLGK